MCTVLLTKGKVCVCERERERGRERGREGGRKGGREGGIIVTNLDRSTFCKRTCREVQFATSRVVR